MDPNCQKQTQIVKNGSNCQKWADCQNQKSRAQVAKLRDWWFSKQTLSKTWWLFMIIWSRIRGTQKRNFGTKLSQKCLPDIARSSSSDIIYLLVPDRRPGSDFPMCSAKVQGKIQAGPGSWPYLAFMAFEIQIIFALVNSLDNRSLQFKFGCNWSIGSREKPLFAIDFFG